MDDPFKHSTLGAGVFYRNPADALDWLERAFGFHRSIVVTDKDGNVVHSEMRIDDAYIVVDSEWSIYRLSQALGHANVSLSRGAIANWVIRSSELLLPRIYDALKEKLRLQPLIRGDETFVQALKGDGRQAQDQSYVGVSQLPGQ